MSYQKHMVMDFWKRVAGARYGNTAVGTTAVTAVLNGGSSGGGEAS